MRHLPNVVRSSVALVAAMVPSTSIAQVQDCKDCPFPMFHSEKKMISGDQYPDPVIPLIEKLSSDSGASSEKLDTAPQQAEAEILEPSTENQSSGNELTASASEIIQVEACLLAFPVPALAIIAVGSFPGGGWSQSDLNGRVYFAPPADGFYDFTLQATRNEIATGNLNLNFRHAVSIWATPPENLVGIRVRGEQEEDYIEVTVPKQTGCASPSGS